MTATVAELRRAVRELADPEIAWHSQRFFKTGPGEYGEGDKFLGVRVPVVRKLVSQFRGTPLPRVNRLLKSACHEERLMALLMLKSSHPETDRTAVSG